ncbi:MAG: large ribosomal subunit protein uL5 [Minisyncoccia bacterium]
MKEIDLKNKIKSGIEKIIVNVGVGKMNTTQSNFEEKILPQIIKDLSLITGQYPQITRAKKSIAGFKLRQGQIVGLKITLRNNKMVDFFNRLVKIVLPRVRDFSGVPKSKIDNHGSLNLGLKEQYAFPEINPEESIIVFPLGINIVSKFKDKKVAEEFYNSLGFPFKK